MNTAQRVVLIVALALIVLSGIYPPWVYGLLVGKGYPRIWNPGPRSFLLGPTEHLRFRDWTPGYYTVTLDTRRLSLEWTVIAAAGVAAFVTAGFKKRHRHKSDHSEAQPS